MKRNKNSNKGFTLVEMLGVLAIIAILISVIAVGVMAAINRARIVATVSNFKNLETAVVGFVALPNSGGTVPLTQASAANTTPIAQFNAEDRVVANSIANDGTFTLDQVLRASGLLDRPLSWRVGYDGSTRLPADQERVFILSRNAWAVADAGTVNGVDVPANGNVWTNYNHCEVAQVNSDAVAYVADTTDFGSIVNTTGEVNFYLDGASPLKASRVAYVVLKNVSLKDAQKLSAELNGSLDDSEFATDNIQVRGRLVYTPSLGAVIPGVDGEPDTNGPANGTVDVYYYLASF